MVILFLIVFFPMINFLWLSVAYGAGWYLNMIEAREVACRPPIESGGPTGNFVTPNYTVSQSQNWKGFMGVIEAAGSPLVAQYASTINPVLIGQSQVQTTVSIKPFMAMPFSKKCRGYRKFLVWASRGAAFITVQSCRKNKVSS